MKQNEIEDLLFKYCLSIEPVAHARVGAILVYKKRIISFGCNRRKTHPLQKRFSKNVRSIFLHAEIDCLRPTNSNSYYNLTKSSLYIGRVKFSNSGVIFGNSKPCIGCQQAIEFFGIKNIFYTTENGMGKL